MKMVTKEDVDKAEADYEAAWCTAAKAEAAEAAAEAVVDAAWDNYIKLREAYDNGN